MSNNEAVVMVSFELFRHTREERDRVDSGQRTGVIDANPAVKMQSASASPGIAIAPRAVVEVPMPESDDGSTGSGAVVDIADALMGSGDEEVNQVEENESWEDDDEEYLYFLFICVFYIYCFKLEYKHVFPS